MSVATAVFIVTCLWAAIAIPLVIYIAATRWNEHGTYEQRLERERHKRMVEKLGK